MGVTWEFQVGSDGAVTGAIIGDPNGRDAVRHWGDPHENLDGKHTKNREGSRQ
jgi:hypothetical protein